MKLSIVFFTWILLTFQGTTWKKKYDQDGIIAWTKNHNSSNLKEFKISMVLNSKKEDIKKILTDLNSLPEWYDMVQSINIYSTSTQGNSRYKIVLDFPWPLKNREVYVYSEIIDEDPSKPTYINSKAETPPKDTENGLVQVTDMSARWELIPIEGGKTKVIHYGYMDPASPIPTYLINKFIIDSPVNTLKALRSRLKE